MESLAEIMENVRQHATVFDVHDRRHDLRVALELYRQVLTSYTADWDDEASLLQIQKIVSEVVPMRDLLNVQVELALAVLGRDRMPEVTVVVNQSDSVGSDRFWDNESMQFVVDWVCAERRKTGD